MDTNNATLRTLIQQSLDSVNHVNTEMGALQKTVQEVQASTGSRIDTMTQQTQGLSDNLQDVQARVGKLAQQLNDVQNTLQSIDAKISGGGSNPGASNGGAPMGSSPSAGGADNSSSNAGSAPSGTAVVAGNLFPAMPPISADTLYLNALRDFTTGKYDLSRQEFTDYTKNFPTNDLAGNAQFYLGEIDYAQGQFPDAINQYDNVLANYPKSFKLAASLLKKGLAELELGKKAGGYARFARCGRGDSRARMNRGAPRRSCTKWEFRRNPLLGKPSHCSLLREPAFAIDWLSHTFFVLRGQLQIYSRPCR